MLSKVQQCCRHSKHTFPTTLEHICACAAATGCFDATGISPEITHGQLFGWEVVMTFTLISVVYACGVAKPGHGSFTPLAVGLSLVACAGTGVLLCSCSVKGWWLQLLNVYESRAPQST